VCKIRLAAQELLSASNWAHFCFGAQQVPSSPASQATFAQFVVPAAAINASPEGHGSWLLQNAFASQHTGASPAAHAFPAQRIPSRTDAGSAALSRCDAGQDNSELP
jgi:hypothetical protein